MLITLLKSKLHRACITDGDVNYEGSVGISPELIEAAGFSEYEKVLIANITNGNRLETYVIVHDGPGQIVLNGAAAHKGKPGDRVIIMSFAQFTPEEAQSHKPRIAVLDEANKVIGQR